jgi:hypothetical protein
MGSKIEITGKAEAPVDWDTVIITVTTSVLSDASTAVDKYVQDVVDLQNSIIKTMNGLQLSWVGQSASDADSFTQAWEAAQTSLFGSSSDPSAGVLFRVSEMLDGAASNYSAVDQWAMTSFQSLVANITGGGGSSPGSPTSVENQPGSVVTFITETFPGS